MASLVLTKGGIHMVLSVDGKIHTEAISKTDKRYEAVAEALRNKESDEAIYNILRAEELRMKAAVQVTPDIEVKGGVVFFKGTEVANTLVERMLEMLGEGFDIVPMARFLENLMNSPSRRVFDNLYSFLEKGNIAITEDGHFLAYKAVRADYLDIHSGTYDNSVGKVLEMPRREVDDDPNRTCSYGFHVASYDYLQYFKRADGHIVICKVNPADVVAIPADYNDTKMRVCKYEVVGELEDQSKDALSDATVMNSSEDLPFSLVGVYSDGTANVIDSYSRLVSAAEAFEDFDETGCPYVRVQVRNNATGAIIEEKEVELDDSLDDDFGGAGDEGETYSLVQRTASGRNMLESDIESFDEAFSKVLEFDLTEGPIDIIDSRGLVERTVS